MASLVQRPDSPVHYIQWRQAGKLKRVSTGSESLQIAKEKLRQFESAQARGGDTGLPTKTPIVDVITGYVEHIRSAKTPKSAQTDIYYLRDAFGPLCEALQITCRKINGQAKKRPPKPGQDRRKKAPIIGASHFEAITTAEISAFIAGRMASRGLAPKTGNRIRDTLSSLFSWAMSQRGIRMPGDRNPVAAVTKYKESAPDILYLTREQIDSQLAALEGRLQLQVMAAVLIYAGLRREELVWLTQEDLDLKAGLHGRISVRAKTVDSVSWQPKTKRNRVVPVSSQLRPYLDRWRVKHSRGTWLFPSPQGKWWDPDNFASDLRAANIALKMGWKNQEGKVTTAFGCLHFRHTFGSMLARRGVSLYHIATLMGNSPEICRRHYAAIHSEMLTDSVEFDAQASEGAASRQSLSA